MLYTITDYSASVYSTDLLQKLASGRSYAQIQKINDALADYPDELLVYRGEAEGSTDYRQAVSWSLDINTAFFFACRHGDQNHAKIIRARIHKTDVIALNLEGREKEILAIPGTPYDVTTKRLIGPDSPSVYPLKYLDQYAIGREQIRTLYKWKETSGFHDSNDREDGTDQKYSEHGRLHSARVLFLAFAIIQAGKIKLNPMERTQLLTAIVFHDISRENDNVDNGHGKAGQKIYEKPHAAPRIMPSAFSSNITVLLTIWRRNTSTPQIRSGQKNAPGSCISF